MFTNLNNNTRGIVLGALGFFCFSMSDAMAKYLTQSYDSSYIVGVVAIFTSALCVLFSPFLGGLKRTFQTKKLKFHLGRGVMNSAVSLLMVFSFSKLSLAGTYTMTFVTPFVTAILAMFFLGEKTNRQEWLAIVVGFIGVLIVLQPGAEDIDLYLLILLAATVFIALLFLLARPLGDEETLVSLALYPALSNLIFITPVTLYIFGLPAVVHLPLFILLAALVVAGLVFTALAFRIGKASVVSMFIYLDIIWAVGFDYFLFHDLPPVSTFIGAAVIIGSGLYLIEIERRGKKL